MAALCNTSADHHMGRGLRKMDRGGGGHARAASTKERRACAHTHSADHLMERGLRKMDRGGGGHTRATSTHNTKSYHPP